jgi:large subunit ribosomal protein L30
MATKKTTKKSTKKKGQEGDGEARTLVIRQVRGTAGVRREHREVLRGLGLRRPNHEVVRQDTPAVRGMLHKVAYLVAFHEETEREESNEG